MDRALKNGATTATATAAKAIFKRKLAVVSAALPNSGCTLLVLSISKLAAAHMALAVAAQVALTVAAQVALTVAQQFFLKIQHSSPN